VGVEFLLIYLQLLLSKTQSRTHIHINKGPQATEQNRPTTNNSNTNSIYTTYTIEPKAGGVQIRMVCLYVKIEDNKI
jgi:hypothetical protein